MKNMIAGMLGGVLGAALVVVCMGAKLVPPVNPAVAVQKELIAQKAATEASIGKDIKTILGDAEVNKVNSFVTWAAYQKKVNSVLLLYLAGLDVQSTGKTDPKTTSVGP